MRKPSIYEIEVKNKLTELKIPFEEEYRFEKSRRWRFDFVLKPVKTKIAIEIEGGVWLGRGHTGGKHFESDCEKYNFASLNGWIILRYTPNTIPRLWEDLKVLKVIK